MSSTIKKVVIAPGNSNASAFFEELSKKKAALKKKIENMASIKKLAANQ